MITIGVFAYNEEHNLSATIQTVMEAARQADNLAHEIIIVDDGSTDNTAEVISELQSRHANIKSITHKKNTGIGTAIKDIIHAATYEKICFVPGDDIFTVDALRRMLSSALKADIVLHYHVNTEVRKKGRVFLSIMFTSIYKLTFNLHVIYINCIGIYPTRILREIKIRSKRHNIAAELNVKTMLQGNSYCEVASYMKDTSQKSSAMTLVNLMDVIKSFIMLLYEVKIRNRDTYNKPPVRVII